MKKHYLIYVGFLLFFWACSHSNHYRDAQYSQFLDRLKADESYIGFFAAEEKLIVEQTSEYLKARRKCFLGISESKEEPFDYVEPFIEFCLENELLKESDEEAWEKVLTILSYELYANMPIFEFSTDEVIEHRDLIYAKYPNKKLALDLFIPKKPMIDPMPVVVCIHGGAWIVNRRIWFEPFAKYLAANGIAAVTIDYRKLPAVEIIDCVHDAKAAVRWVRANAQQYGIDSNKIGALGASAGAHLVTLLGTTANVSELEGNGGNPNISSEIQEVVGFATPGFTPSTDIEEAAEFGFKKENRKLLSPYENITAESAPLYLIHGTEDEVVPPENSQEMYDKYQAVGVHVELKWIPDEGHGFYEGTDVGIQLATDFFIRRFK